MSNEIVVFSKSSKRWIKPRTEKFECITGLRKRVGHEALIRLETGAIHHVMVERSYNGAWWLVDTGRRK